MQDQPLADLSQALDSPVRAHDSPVAHSHSDQLDAQLLHALACGVLLVNQRGSILRANRAGRAELARCRVIAEANGSLYALAVQDGKALQAAIDQAITGQRALVNLRARGLELSVVLVPIRGAGSDAEPLVALYLARDEVCEEAMLGHFAHLYRLSPTEREVLGILVQGYNTPEVAILLNMAVSTVRSHVKNLCNKTLSGGIRELVSRVAVLPPVSTGSRREAVH